MLREFSLGANVEAAKAVATVTLLALLFFVPANAAVSEKEHVIENCIMRALDEHEWPPNGSFVPWGEHHRVEFTYKDSDGHRVKQVIYVFQLRSKDELAFGMELHSPKELEIGNAIEQQCHVAFQVMSH